MKPQTYRKRPVEVQAMHYDGSRDSARRIMNWAGADARLDRRPQLNEHSLYITTIEGDIHVSPGDYVIRGVRGEFYPCKPDIFEIVYEKITEGGMS